MTQSFYTKLSRIEDKAQQLDKAIVDLINENFTIIDLTLKRLAAGGTIDGSITIEDLAESIFAAIVEVGLEADMPVVEDREGRVFYWAYDTERFFLLRETEEGS